MRTKNKDILMICKLWFITKDSCYDQESALCDYLKSRTMRPEIADESILHHLTSAVGEFIDKTTLLMTMKEFATDEFHQVDNPVAFLIRTYISLLHDVSVENIDLSDYDKMCKYVTKNKTDKTAPQWWKYDNSIRK